MNRWANYTEQGNIFNHSLHRNLTNLIRQRINPFDDNGCVKDEYIISDTSG